MKKRKRTRKAKEKKKIETVIRTSLPPQGGTLVTRAYILTVEIYSQYARRISNCLNRGREESGDINDDVSIVRARKYEMVRMT